MPSRIIAFLLATPIVFTATGFAAVFTTADDVKLALQDKSNLDADFDVTGTVLSYYKRDTDEWVIQIATGTNTLHVYELNAPDRPAEDPGSFHILDHIRFRGRLYSANGKLYAGYETATLLREGDLSTLPVIQPQELHLPDHCQKVVRLRGRIRDIARDVTDPNFLHLTIQDVDGQASAMMLSLAGNSVDYMRYFGALAVVTGYCPSPHENGARRHLGPFLIVSGQENIQIVNPPSTFRTAPDLETLEDRQPREIAASGLYATSGDILAVWGSDTFLLRTHTGRFVRTHIQYPPLPSFGMHVRVIGLPTTDFYNLKLIHSIWERDSTAMSAPEAPTVVSPSDLLTNTHGFPELAIHLLGHPIQITGIVRFLPDMIHPGARALFESGRQIVAVDASAQPALLANLELGSTVSVSGICVMEADNWNVNSADDTNHGFFIVPRTADDIVVLSRPPWWTPGRLMALLGVLAAALLGIIGWNVSLNRRAKRKGEELAAEQLAHVTSELKVSERTRLAVELHDALSQTLTGVSMQIDTAAGFAEGKVPAITKCLNLASRTIDACRKELRNTLWDLRSAALDEPSMDSAIHKTLCQNLAGIDLTVRFNVAREAFSDNTAHAVLKIIRELATNALRHGKATSLKIAGTVDGGKLRFSVRDNGCGFDPDLVPGIAQGHFGLQGIAERLERLNGELKIVSVKGKGTRATVTLPIPRSGE